MKNSTQPTNYGQTLYEGTRTWSRELDLIRGLAPGAQEGIAKTLRAGQTIGVETAGPRASAAGLLPAGLLAAGLGLCLVGLFPLGDRLRLRVRHLVVHARAVGGDDRLRLAFVLIVGDALVDPVDVVDGLSARKPRRAGDEQRRQQCAGREPSSQCPWRRDLWCHEMALLWKRVGFLPIAAGMPIARFPDGEAAIWGLHRAARDQKKRNESP